MRWEWCDGQWCDGSVDGSGVKCEAWRGVMYMWGCDSTSGYMCIGFTPKVFF